GVCRAALLAVGVAALALKLSLLASGTYTGFLACYRSPLSAPPSDPCERSFENPFFRFGVTRIDPAINFGERDWDLGFLNARRFNFYPTPGYQGPLRWRVPIAATWQGVTERPEAWVARITYVGEATVTVVSGSAAADDATTPLPSHYGPPATVLVPVP